MHGVARAVPFLLLAGCAAADGGGNASVRDSAGIRIVESAAPAWTERTHWRVSAEPVLRIGAVSSPDPAYEFSEIRAVRRLSDGRVVVLDGQSSEVRWFAADGRHLVSRGGPGRGPAELAYPSALIRLPGDTIVVDDRPGPIQHEFFAPDGTHVRMEAIDMARLLEVLAVRECLQATLPDRSLLLCREEPDSASPPEGPGHHRGFQRYVRLPWTLDTLSVLGLHGGLEQWGFQDGGRLRFARHPFHARTAVAVGGPPLRIATSIGPAYSIELWTPGGRLDRIVRRIGARRTPTEAEGEAVREMMARYALSDEAFLNRILREMPVPDSVPAVTLLALANTGELWVTREGFLPPHTETVFDVFDPEGRFLGTLRLPPFFWIHEIGEDWILGVRRDEYDVEYVELYSLDRR